MNLAIPDKTDKKLRPMTVAAVVIIGMMTTLFSLTLSASSTSPGDLDVTFDVDGWNTISGNNLWFEASAVVVQSSGKIVIGGHRMNGAQFDPLIARFNADGSFDTSFGSDGTGIVVSPWPTVKQLWNG